MLKNFLVIVFSLFILTGCCSKNDKEILTFSSWGSVTEVNILKKIISDFEVENPNIKIEFIHIPQNYFQKIHLLFASNTAPDVLFMNNLYLPIYEKKLEDLTTYFQKEDFYPQAISGMSYSNRILGIPRDISNLVLYVNLDKLSLPKESWTIEDLYNFIQIATKNKTYGIGCEEDIYWVTPYLAYFGGGVLNSKSEIIIDSKESQRALQFYLDLINKDKYAPTKSQIGSSTLAQMFLEGKIAMYLSGRWMYPKIEEKANFNWAVINFPYGQNLQYCDVSGWVISKDSKHKENALKFVEFLSNEKSSKYFTETGLIVPARIEAAKLLNNNEHNEKIFLDVIEKSQNTPTNKDYKKIIDKINLEKF